MKIAKINTKQNYIDYKVKGSITVKGKTEKERKENFEKQLQQLLEEKYPSFFKRNIAQIMKDRVLLGVDKEKRSRRRNPEIEIKYTNIKNMEPDRIATPEKEKKWMKEEKRRLKKNDDRTQTRL